MAKKPDGLVWFHTDLFKKNKPCLYINVTTNDLPEHLRLEYVPGTNKNPCYEPSRITINDVSDRLVLCLIARYIIERLDKVDLNYIASSPDMDYYDIQAALADPDLDRNQPYMVNHKIPVQIVVQGISDIMWMLDWNIQQFLTRQMVGKRFGWAEFGHHWLTDINHIQRHPFIELGL